MTQWREDPMNRKTLLALLGAVVLFAAPAVTDTNDPVIDDTQGDESSQAQATPANPTAPMDAAQATCDETVANTFKQRTTRDVDRAATSSEAMASWAWWANTRGGGHASASAALTDTGGCC